MGVLISYMSTKDNIKFYSLARLFKTTLSQTFYRLRWIIYRGNCFDLAGYSVINSIREPHVVDPVFFKSYDLWDFVMIQRVLCYLEENNHIAKQNYLLPDCFFNQYSGKKIDPRHCNHINQDSYQYTRKVR